MSGPSIALLHDSVEGIYLLHWLSVAVPAATLVVVSGALRPTVVARLLLLGVLMTGATLLFSSVAPATSQLRYGAPLPMLSAGIDPSTEQVRTALTVLRACLVANILFWSSTALLLGAGVRVVAGRVLRSEFVRRRRTATRLERARQRLRPSLGPKPVVALRPWG